MSKRTNTVVYFDWKTVIYIYVCGKCRTQFMLPMEKSVTFTGTCANEIMPSINRSFVYKAKEGRHIRIIDIQQKVKKAGGIIFHATIACGWNISILTAISSFLYSYFQIIVKFYVSLKKMLRKGSNVSLNCFIKTSYFVHCVIYYIIPRTYISFRSLLIHFTLNNIVYP